MDIVSWLISHPESVAIGRDLQTLIWQADRGVASGSEVVNRAQKLQSELEALKKVMPNDAKFIEGCVFAVGTLVQEFGK